MKYIKLNENIALAKSILRKNGIAEDNEDYLKIREMVGTAFSYVGILTRLRFVDNVTDMEELKSIFEVLRDSKLDLGKLNKMSYDQILDTFYDQMTSPSKEDYELIYKDSTYSFFRVYTYKGILEIGSPAWCLKTKSHWDNYQSKYPEQWVAIDNRYVKNIVTPNNNYFTDAYRNTSKSWVRFGISMKHELDDTISFVAHNDNDDKCEAKPENHTFYGVFFTTMNLSTGHKKSYYQRFLGCDNIKDGVFKINGDRVFTDRLKVKAPSKDDVNYLLLSKSYSFAPMVLKLRDRSTPILRVFTTNKNKLYLLDIVPENSAGKAITEYVQVPRNTSYIGIRIKLGLITVEQAKDNPQFILQVGKWLVFYWNDEHYIAVDTEPGDYVIPVMDLYGNEYWSNNEKKDILPIFYFIDSKKIENVDVMIDTPESQEILRQLSSRNPENPKEDKKPGFIKRFFGFK
jgi:hypothetical protein